MKLDEYRLNNYDDAYIAEVTKLLNATLTVFNFRKKHPDADVLGRMLKYRDRFGPNSRRITRFRIAVELNIASRDDYLIESQDIVATASLRFSQSLAAQVDNSFVQTIKKYQPIATQTKVFLEMNGEWILKRVGNNRKPTAKLLDLEIP